MSTATYYPPSTTSSITTSWIPLTTVYGNHGAACATQIRAFSDYFSAWYPDDINFSFGSSCVPAEVTAWVNLNYEYPLSTYFHIGPFAGCPDAYTLATSYTTDPVSGMTICCPRSYSLFTDGADTGCASQFTSGQVVTYEFENLTTSATASTDTNVRTLYTIIPTTVTTISSLATITALPIKGWNFAKQTQPPMTTTGSTAVTSVSSCSIPPGAIAGIAVSGTLGLVGIVALVAGLYFFLYTRKQRKSAPNGSSPPYTTSHEPSMSAGPAFRNEMSPVPAYDQAKFELPSNTRE